MKNEGGRMKAEECGKEKAACGSNLSRIALGWQGANQGLLSKSPKEHEWAN